MFRLRRMDSILALLELSGSAFNTRLHTFAPAIARDVIVRVRAAGGSDTLINSEVSIQTHSEEPVAAGTAIYRIVERKTG